MPTKREREYYAMGFADAMRMVEARKTGSPEGSAYFLAKRDLEREYTGIHETTYRKPKRKLSAWNKYVKNKRNHIKYRTGPDKGKLNLRLMGVAFRRTPAGKKKRR